LNIHMVLHQALANEEDNSKASHSPKDNSEGVEPNSNTKASPKDKLEVVVPNSNTKAKLKDKSEVVMPNSNVKASRKVNLANDHFSLMDIKDQQLFMWARSELNIHMVQHQVLVREEVSSKASHSHKDNSEDMEPNSNTKANLKDKWEVAEPNFNAKASPKDKSDDPPSK